MLQSPIDYQDQVMHGLIKTAVQTRFGRDHSFKFIKDYETFKGNISLRKYEALRPYIDRIKAGEKGVLWPGIPLYFGITAGTTSGSKYIPVTKASLENQKRGPEYFGVNYAHRYKRLSQLKGKVLLFSDGPLFEDVGVMKGAPISTIVHQSMPKLFRLRSLPSCQVNSIKDFEARMHGMVRQSIRENVTAIVAMPISLLSYLRTLENLTAKSFDEHFPNFKLLMFSGMDYKPFLPEIRRFMPSSFTILESYPSTEGFIAYQDRAEESGMQLVLDNGIFYEFVPVDEIHLEKPTRISLKDVEIGRNYALVLNTNAGLWGYIIGDVVRFKTLHPHRIEITGRIGQFISAFGEHVIVEETDTSIAEIADKLGCTIVNYTVAPHFGVGRSCLYHEWFIEFGIPPKDLGRFASLLDDRLMECNSNYKDCVQRKAITSLEITVIPENGFKDFMHKTGKVGMQQKMPHLTNDYALAKQLKTILDLE